jgi:tetratricopeptide (TPR) repeat protein
LAFDPQDRLPSAALLASLLHKQNSLFRRANRCVRRHPLTFVGCGIFLMICLLLFGSWLALRDPYAIRLYKKGLIDIQKGNPAEAAEMFNEALVTAPDNLEILLDRGKAYHRQGKYEQAFDDYNRVYSLNPTGEVAELRSHCLSKMKYYREAIIQYEIALKSGCQTISLMNNLGFCYMQMMQFSEAEDYFKKALLLNPRCNSAWHNMVRLSIRRFSRDNMPFPDIKALINNALDTAETTPQLFLDIAILEARIAKRDSSVIPKVLAHLHQAVALGADPRRIADEFEFSHLRNQKEFSAILQQSPGACNSRESDGLIPPF